MRILHVVQALSKNFGGVTTVLLDLVREQCKAGLFVDVVSTNVDAPKGVLPVPTNRFIENDGVRFRYSSVQFRPMLFSIDLKKYLDQHMADYDIVNIFGLYRFPPTYAAYQARKKGIPYIIRPHGSLDPYLFERSSRSVLLKRQYERWFDLPNLHRASAIQYTSVEERTRAAFLKLDAPSFVLPNGLNWDKFRTLPSRGALRASWNLGNVPLILFLGRIHLKKGLDLLIPAFEDVRKTISDAQLLIVGPENDEYGKKVRGWIRERNLQDAVHFAGPLNGIDVVQAYVDADIFVLPSYTENFGMSVVEAMACSTPVVISDQVNIHAEISQAGAGLVTRCDVGEVADAMTILLCSAEQRFKMGEAGRRVVREKYSWPMIVKKLSKEYEHVIERHLLANKNREIHPVKKEEL